MKTLYLLLREEEVELANRRDCWILLEGANAEDDDVEAQRSTTCRSAEDTLMMDRIFIILVAYKRRMERRI
jgi:hypothetical protein